MGYDKLNSQIRSVTSLPYSHINYRIGARDGSGAQFSGYGNDQVSGYSDDGDKNDIVAVKNIF